MVIQLVAHGGTLVPHLLTQLSVNKLCPRTGHGRSVVTEYISDVVEQTGNREQDRGGLLWVVEEMPGVDVPLADTLIQPVDSLFFVLRDIFTGEVQFTQHILRIRISTLCRLRKPLHSFLYILFNYPAPQILLTQAVGGVVAAVTRGTLQPFYAELWVTDFDIVREVQLAQRILRYWDIFFCRSGEPVPSFPRIWDQQRTVTVELSQQVLCVRIATLGHAAQFLHRLIPSLQCVGIVINDTFQIPVVC